MNQLPRRFLSWGSNDREIVQSARVTADAQLYHTLCSVIQDAELYFSLCTTPLWIRVLYTALGWIPYYGNVAREGLIGLALYIQLRVIFYKNDCWTDQGTVRIDWYYWTAPEWVWKFQGWSTVVISQATLSLLYWLGRFMLGMRESYNKYNVLFDSLDWSERYGDKVVQSERPL